MKFAVKSGDPERLSKALVGRPIWVVIPPAPEKGFKSGHITGPHRVLHFKKFFPAGPVIDDQGKPTGSKREKHLVQIYADPPGNMTLSVGSIRLKDPGRVAAGKRAAEARAEQDEDD